MNKSAKLKSRNVNVYIVTWNVGSETPDSINLNNLLGLERDAVFDRHPADIYVIGLQEVKANIPNVIMSMMRNDPWTQKFKSVLKNRDYIAIKTEHMQGLHIIVFAKREHLLHMRQIETAYTRTGFAGYWGNKGAVSVRFNVYGNTIAFVNAHLAAHDKELDERIEDFNMILQYHRYKTKPHCEIFDHDYVFWFGDLNFRLSEEDNTSAEYIRSLIAKDKLEQLITLDQLVQVRKQKRAFHQLEEQTPKFPPTFKFIVGTNEYNMKRRPAWCDRVLWKVNPNTSKNDTLIVKQLAYKSHPGYIISDHKPVSSQFLITVTQSHTIRRRNVNHNQLRAISQVDSVDIDDKQVHEDPAEGTVEFSHIPIWYIGDDNVIQYTIPAGFEEAGNDWIGVYKSDFDDLSDYIAYEYVSAADNRTAPLGIGGRPIKHSIHLEFSDNIDLVEDENYILLYFQNTGLNGITGLAGMSNVFRAEKRPPSPRFVSVE